MTSHFVKSQKLILIENRDSQIHIVHVSQSKTAMKPASRYSVQQ